MPVVLGHEFVGRAAELGDCVTTNSSGRTLAVGDRFAVGPGVVLARDFFTDVAGQPTLAAQSLGYGVCERFPDLPRHVAGRSSSAQPTLLHPPPHAGDPDQHSNAGAAPTVSGVMQQGRTSRIYFTQFV